MLSFAIEFKVGVFDHFASKLTNDLSILIFFCTQGTAFLSGGGSEKTMTLK